MAEIIYSNGIPILLKRVKWDEYKSNYNQDEKPYSKWSNNINTGYLKDQARNNYRKQSDKHRLKFQQKYSGIEDPEKNIEVIAQLEALEAYLTKDIFKKSAQDAISKVLNNFDKSKIMYPALKQLASSKKGTDAYSKALLEVKKAEKYFSEILNVQIPEAVLDSTKPRTTQNIAEALYMASLDPGAITSYLNTVQLLESLTNAANEVPGAMTELGQLIFQKYSSNLDENGKKILSEKGTLGSDFDKYYKKGKQKIVAKTNRTIGNTMAKTTATLFEVELPKAIVATAGEGVTKIIKETMSGVNRGSNNRQGKEDNIIAFYGQKIDLNTLGDKSHTTFDVPLLNPNEVKMNISVKQYKKETGGTLQDSTINTLFGKLNGMKGSTDEEIRYRTLLYHYYQLYETSSGKNSTVMDAVNAYVVSKIADSVIGDNVDFIVYKNGAISKHTLLQEMSIGTGKFFRLHIRPSSDMFKGIESAKGQIKNIKK